MKQTEKKLSANFEHSYSSVLISKVQIKKTVGHEH